MRFSPFGLVVLLLLWLRGAVIALNSDLPEATEQEIDDAVAAVTAGVAAANAAATAAGKAPPPGVTADQIKQAWPGKGWNLIFHHLYSAVNAGDLGRKLWKPAGSRQSFEYFFVPEEE